MTSFSFTAVDKRSKQVESGVSDRERLLLYKAAKIGHGKGVIVEIGSYKGKSTIYLAGGSKAARREKVYAVDPHLGAKVIDKQFSGPTYSQFLKNVKNNLVSDYVKPIRNFSDQAVKKWKDPIRLLFIDGDHSYKSVSKDIKLWGEYLIDGGIIALHDSLNPGVGPPRAIIKQLINSRSFCRMGVADSIFYAVKLKPKTIKDNINWLFYKIMMSLVSGLLNIRPGQLNKRLRNYIRQYIVKTYIKNFLSWVSKNDPLFNSDHYSN